MLNYGVISTKTSEKSLSGAEELNWPLKIALK
jgi:hypothetical protein